MDMERTMEFIVETLADVAVRQQQAEARAKQADVRLEKMERQMKGIQTLVKTGMNILIEHGRHLKNLDVKIAALTDAQIRAQDEMREMRGNQKRADQKFERWLDSMNKGSNGHKKKPN
jgi:hypothetical protein